MALTAPQARDVHLYQRQSCAHLCPSFTTHHHPMAPASSATPPAGLVGGAIGAAVAFIFVLVFLAFIFWRLAKREHSNQQGLPQSQPQVISEKFNIRPFKFAIPQRLYHHRKTPSDVHRLEPLLSSFRPSYSTDHSLDREREPQPDDNLHYVPPVTYSVPVTAPRDSSRRRMPTKPIRAGTRNNAFLTNPTTFIRRNSSTSAPTERSLSRSSLTWSRYLPSLIIPASPPSSNGVASSHLTPGSNNHFGDSSSSSGQHSSDSNHSDRPPSYSRHTNSDKVPTVPPLPSSASQVLERSETVLVTNLLKDRVGRTEPVLSRAYSRSSGLDRTISNASVYAEVGVAAAGPSNPSIPRTRRSTSRKKSTKASTLDKRTAKAELNARSPHIAKKGWRAYESPAWPQPPPLPQQRLEYTMVPSHLRSLSDSDSSIRSLPPLPPDATFPPLPRSFPDTMGSARAPSPDPSSFRQVVPTASQEASLTASPAAPLQRDDTPGVLASGNPPNPYASTAPLNILPHGRQGIATPGMPPRALVFRR